MNLDKRYEEVIRVGDSWFYSMFSGPLILLVYGLAVIVSVFFIVFLVDSLRDWKRAVEDKEHRYLISFGVVLVVCAGLIVGFNSESDRIEKWKSEDVVSLLNDLPVKESVVVSATMGSSFWGDDSKLRYLESVDKSDFIPFTLSINDDGKLVSITNRFDTRMTLADGSDPYLEYKHVKKDLGNGVRDGFYDAVLYLPKDYKFTDSK